jgi:hypothetical protein
LAMTLSFPGAHTARHNTMRASCTRPARPSGEVGPLTTALKAGSGRVEVERGWCGAGRGYERSWR